MPLDPVYLCTRQDVIDRFGGAGDLTQAIDPNQTGTYDTDLLDRARLDSASDVMAAGGNQVKLWAVNPEQIPQWVVKIAAQRAVVYVWDYGTNGKARSDGVKLFWDAGERDLERLRKGETGTGYGEPAARNSPRPRIDNTDGGRRATYGAFRRSGWG